MRWAIIGTLAFVFGPMLFMAPIIGMLTDPWAPFRLSGQVGTIDALPVPELPGVTIPAGDLSPIHGRVTDAQRYQLARAVGWNPPDAIIITAISIAEDGSGDPQALSAANRDGSRDYGVLQINSSHWNSCGGQQALADPFNNFVCGHSIYLSQGFCAWSTYEPSCGPGHTGSYRGFLQRAKVASEVQLPPRQA